MVYVDFSISNIGFRLINRTLIPCMMDFGSMHPISFPSSPSAKTIRYCSGNAVAGRLVNEKDDFESLGFVLVETFCGLNQSPLNEHNPQTPTSKQQLILNARAGKYGLFLKHYFFVVESDQDLYEDFLQLADSYQTV